MMCPSCGAGNVPGVRFCGACGHRFDGATADAPRSASASGNLYPEDDPYIGQVLNNRFVIETKLGEGGFGAVYRGTQKGTGRKVALKLLHPEMTQDDNLVARFRREGLLMCNLNDAHTVTTYDFDQTPDGTLFIAMELLEGRSMHDIFHAEAPLAWQRMFKIIVQMCSSLAEAHAQGIVHRDLKPENICIESRPADPEFVKILDFGIAKVMQGEGQPTPQLTATGQTLGTLEYMSPEQLMGKELDGRSDVYTVGVLAYEMITGRLPFPDAKGPAALITAQLRQVPEPPSRVSPAGYVPASVDRIILKMLEKDKAKRFTNVDELRMACTEALHEASAWSGSAPELGTAPAPASPLAGAIPPGPAIAPPPPGMGAAGAPRPITPMSAGPAMPAAQPAPVAQPAHAGLPMPAGLPALPGPPAPAWMPMHAPMQPGVPLAPPPRAERTWLWLVLGLIVLGGLVGAAIALT